MNIRGRLHIASLRLQEILAALRGDVIHPPRGIADHCLNNRHCQCQHGHQDCLCRCHL